MVVRVIVDVIQLYIVLLFARLVMSWFPIDPWSRLAKLVRALARITDPVLTPIRRIMPPLRFGATAIDLSPIVLFFALEIVLSILQFH
ncbi:MAG TPA: YggT family protein [Acidimicrobiales bacterium]|nr:YggT family protein [Acidimicrobiales bacterium]